MCFYTIMPMPFRAWKNQRPFFFVLVSFLWQKNSITVQRLQASSILSWAIDVGLTTSWLPPHQNTPPISTTNLLQAIDFWYEKNTTKPTTSNRFFDMDRVWHLVWTNLTSCKFSLFFSYAFVHFPNLLCLSIKFRKLESKF